jgi:hypothetical protein
MHSRAKMVYGMVAIIPAHFIVLGIDAIDSAGKIVFRICFINKRMLCPITQHHYYACKNQRNNKYHQSSFEVYKAHSHTKNIKRYFADTQAHIQLLSFAVKKI